MFQKNYLIFMEYKKKWNFLMILNYLRENIFLCYSALFCSYINPFLQKLDVKLSLVLC